MRPQLSRIGLSAAILASLPSIVSAVTLDCSHLRIDGQSFDFSPLSGPYSVHLIEETPPAISNTTFTIDICSPIKKNSARKSADQCPAGTRVCGIEEDYNSADDSSIVKKVIPIAGEYTSSHGRALDPVLTRLKGSQSNSDSNKEGVRVELNGGAYPFTESKSKGTPQKAIIEFECDAQRTGLEGLESAKGSNAVEEGQERNLKIREDGEGDGDNKKDGKEEETVEASLQFVSYKNEVDGKDEVGVLRLTWRTKYACEDQRGTAPPSSGGSSKHWGFFTWFIIIVFLAIAAYLIFGSWLNYNRYGARGWDLVPHGDTIRDLPYSIKDWGRSLIGVVQGHGSRGGYSAV